jgi:hypothetical protein
VAIALTIYTHVDTGHLRNRAMDLFENLLKLQSREAEEALRAIDR